MDNLEKVFNEIVETYSERLYWHVRRFTCSHEDTDDLLQDIFIKIWKALPSFRGEAQLYTWVFRIATNETLNFLRKEKVRSLLRFQSADAEIERKIDSDPYFNGTQAERALSKEIAKLPEKQRIVFIMRYYDDMPYEDISQVLDTSVGSLKASYHIAQQKIREALKKLDISF
ncbi:MAG: RNA polymerase sigma factor [Bacteroidales bacterium]|nr:RNA polymerase sigma factor [Bacteroidales bacterium]